MKRFVFILSVFLISGSLNFLLAQEKDSVNVLLQPDSLGQQSPMIVTSQEDHLGVPSVIPPSPDAAALGKYGNYPVGLNTGIPDINIPIFTIKSSQLTLPISLSYHSSGVKVAEFASWVGLGWSLNAGGAISVSVVGLPDHSGGFYDRYDILKTSQLSNSNYEYMGSIANNLADGESDFYFYNFNGHSGKFVHTQNTHTPLLIPNASIKITYTSPYYTIIDEMGVTYKFTTPEYLRFYRGPNSYDYISSYYLSKIISADGRDSISFTYTVENGYSENNNRYTETIGQVCSQPGPPGNIMHTSGYVTDSRGITPVVLQQISFATGKVEFIKDNTRRDAPKSRLDTIKISEKNSDGTFTLRKKFALAEKYFTTADSSTTELNRLKLAGITEMDIKNNTVKSYRFLYNETEQLPSRNSLSQDWWGYYNGQGNSSLIKYETIGFEGHDYQVGGANREPNATKMKVGILDSIIYPTGGATKFIYEPNYYNDGGSNTLAGGLRVKEMRDYEGVGKIPITRLYRYGTGRSGSGTLLIPAYGLANSKQTYNFEWWYPAGNFCVPGCYGKRMNISGGTALDLTSLNGAPVVYPEVAVYENDTIKKPNGWRVFRFDVSPDLFLGVDQAYNNGEYQMNNSWKGGNETYVGSYIKNSTRKGLETYNVYSLLQDTSIIGTKIGWKITREGCPNPPEVISTDYYYFDYPIYSGIKKLTSASTRQYSSAENDTTSILSQTVYSYNNLHDNHQQLTTRKIINSSRITDSTQYWYPADYDGSISVINSLKTKNIIALPIKEEHYKNKKIVDGKITQYNNYGHPTEIDIYETDLPKTPPVHNPGTIFPVTGYVKRLDLTYDANYNLQTVTKSDDITTSYLWGYQNALPIAEVKNAGTNAFYFNNFENSDGNSTLNDCKSGKLSRVGGFSKSLTGMLYGKSYGDSITYILSWWSKSSGIWNYNSTTVRPKSGNITISLTGQVDDVRLLLNKATMKTYTYNPLVGMTSATDENNVIMYYEYDDAGNLKYIKDQDGNILQYFDYHYKTSN